MKELNREEMLKVEGGRYVEHEESERERRKRLEEQAKKQKEKEQKDAKAKRDYYENTPAGKLEESMWGIR